MTTRSILLLTASLVAPTLYGCAAPDGDLGCADGKCDEDIPDSPCDGLILDESGHGFKKIGGRNNDAVAKLLFRDGECPTSMPAMMAKLREVDTDGCSGDTAGIQTRLISETAQATGRAPNAYRSVTSRACGGRNSSAILFSQFVSPTAKEAPETAEFISLDETSGVFNYYEADGDKITFFGSSKDFLRDEGGRCKSCHTDGGLIMKELDSPWIHWEGHKDHPGSGDLVRAIKDFGSKSSGIEFEGTVVNANAKYNTTRLELLKDGENVTEQVLRPLFCTVQINLANGAAFESPVAGGPGGDELRSIPFKAFLDPALKSFGGFSVTFADYDAQIKANGQRVQGIPNAIDSIFDLTFPMRSRADVDYVEKLVSGGIVDGDFVKDALMVDFTRSIFSDDRCGLLSFAPKLSGSNLNPTSIREGFIANLEAESPVAGSPAATFLAHLKAEGDGSAHQGKVDAFVAACNALGSKRLVDNAMQVISGTRTTVRERPIIEFPATLATDNLRTDASSRLHPTDCSVTTRYVAP
ncbi:MAG: hypothetical protein KF773_27255 [Deltaproteobacteria bacterium]|nr:hypothetical protein [Deltaproteobacteria bacterium]MCW5803019.1 hypothetical protein [Deltaproteobacteria bacterium]